MSTFYEKLPLIAPGDLLAFNNSRDMTLHETFDVDEWMLGDRNTKVGKDVLGIVVSAIRATPTSQVSAMYVFTPHSMGWQWRGNPYRIIRKWID